MKDTLVEVLANAGIFILILLFQMTVSTFIIWISWNSLIPNLFTTLREISFGEALALYVLSNALLKFSVASNFSSTKLKN